MEKFAPEFVMISAVFDSRIEDPLGDFRLTDRDFADLTKLVLWCKTASQATRVPIHPQYPLVGDDAFRTATGVHAAAIIKAEKKGDAWLADRIYSGVPAGTRSAQV